MAIVHGQIESLKRIKETLSKKGITRFNSTGEIQEFTKNFEQQKQNSLNDIRIDIDTRLNVLRNEKDQLEASYEMILNEKRKLIYKNIASLSSRILKSNLKANKNFAAKIYSSLVQCILEARRAYLRNNFERISNRQTKRIKRKVLEALRNYVSFAESRKKYIQERSLIKLRELTYIKETVDGLSQLIAGAVGENLVVLELQKLSDQYFVINDFTLNLNPPIYNKSEKDRIYSIQIDHLVISRSGLFILETKNWSKESLDRLDLRSPVAQIKRTNYALWILLNGSSDQSIIELDRHHWGDKQIPIKNVIVMIGAKPKDHFQYVQIKKLGELNNYISFFDPIFNDSELRRIINCLEKIRT